MTHPVSDYEYHLPPDRIAQSPMTPRELAKLMVIDRSKNTRKHFHVGNLPDFLHKGDVMVINNTKVFHARLHGQVHEKSVELFLIRPTGETGWTALGKPGKKFRPGDTVRISGNVTASVVSKHDDGTMTVSFDLPPGETIAMANKYGEVPIPPYIKKIPKDSDYQTVYAKLEGSVAAPTAGFHLTRQILARLKDKGVTVLEITLHVGLGTFMPMKSETLESHAMHSEWAEISPGVAEAIMNAKKEHRRIIAVGTTTVRTLEGVAALHDGILKSFRGDINLFITPGFRFRIIDGLLTNFHLPKSTLIVLVSAFAGRKRITHAYEEAVRRNYRFYSFGDAMLIL